MYARYAFRSGVMSMFVLMLWLANTAWAVGCIIDEDCADSVDCTVDTCDGGVCSNTPDHAACTNGAYCDGAETCDSSLGCLPGAPVDCSDEVYCTEDSCDEVNDTCVNTPVDSYCDDDTYCTGVEACDPQNGDEYGCVAGTPVACDDGMACTNDVCSNAGETCVYTPINSRCDDGLYCNGTESCQPLNAEHDADGCVPGSEVTCNDNIACSDDACDETIDGCGYVANDANCDDGNPCTGPGACDPNDFMLWPSGCDNSNLPDGTLCTLEGGGNGICVTGACTDTCFENSHCDDGFSCTTDVCNAGSCEHTPVNSACADTLYCNGVESCDPADGSADPTTGCVAGVVVDCDDGVSCTDDSCNETSDSCDNIADDSACDNGDYCDGAEVCHAQMGCVAGTAVTCDDGIACTTDSCDESSDSCKFVANHSACDDGDSCTADSCSLTEDCVNAPRPDGIVCGTNHVCLAGVCVNGCNNDADCNDNIACTTDSCNLTALACVNTPVDAACDDASVCTGTETCAPEDGAADPTTGCVAGTSLTCADTDPCTADSCDPINGCEFPAAADGTGCDLLPEIPEVCSGGVCVVACSTNADCDDSIDCTTDTCSQTTHLCVYTNNNNYCNDYLLCNGTETCDPDSPNAQADGCVPGVSVVCNDGFSCTDDSCDDSTGACIYAPNHETCSDSDVCTGIEVCDTENGAADPTTGCVAGVALDCNDTNPCTSDSCDAVTGCDTTRLDNGTPCDVDPQVDEVCIDGVCTEACTQNVDCDDGVACTVDVCNLETYQCESTADNGICSTGTACDGVQLCGPTEAGADPATGCYTQTPAPSCDDGFSCTVDSCVSTDESSYSCDYAPSDGACTNGVFCDGAEFCSPQTGGADPTTGCVAGVEVDCNDGIACTVDSCDEANNSCKNDPDHTACANLDFCDGVEICDLTLGCIDGPDPDCSDGVACTVDGCDEQNDVCTHETDDTACDNGLFCDGSESCTPAGCVPGVAPDCNDGIACTADSCNEVGDVCAHAPNNGLCGNGVFCDGVEICDLSQGCIDGPDPDCDDGIACTIDYCDPINDFCSGDLDHGLCDDGAYCNGAELCLFGVGCISGTPVTCNDGVDCTADNCNEATDRCDFTADDSLCDDGAFCNGAEYCHPTLDCLPGDSVVCNDDIACTTDSCSNAEAACVFAPDDGACAAPGPCRDLVGCDTGSGCLYTNKDDNTSCDVNPELAEVCRGGVCVPGCVQDSDCNDGLSCTSDTCGQDGYCAYQPLDSACDNGVFCDGAELCVVGEGCVAGPTRSCNDGFACTTDSCDEVNDVCVNTANNGYCDDEIWCNGAETCVPTDENADAAGCVEPAPRCDDGIACTENLCDEGLQQCSYPPQNTACDDAVFCNGAEVCAPEDENADEDGCIGGEAPACDDGFACTVDSCDTESDACAHAADNGVCADTAYCNGAEICNPDGEGANAAGCVPGLDPCDDGVLCTLNSCDEVNDRCVYTPSDGLCADTQFCNGVEVCDPDSSIADFNGCVAGSDPCDDAIACTLNQCDEAGDRCTNPPSDGLCNDDLFCNGVETCDPQNGSANADGCVAGSDPCDDAIACTLNECDEAGDSCTNPPSDAACADGQFCNGVEICDPQNGNADADGCVPGDAPCDDAIACTADDCDEAGDRCTHDPNDSACDNSVFCDGPEVCQVGVGCVAGTPPACDDAVACTVDGCNSQRDECEHTPDDTACDNGSYCDGAEVCTATGCEAGTPVDCDDNVACTADSCDEAGDNCVHAPQDNLCSDGQFCNGVEICDPQNGCGPGVARDCDDQIACTVDSCNEADDICLHLADHTACDDGEFCSGDEYCSVDEGCYTVVRACDDGVACTDDSCNEDDDECVFTASDENCEDDNPCTGPDVCDYELDCSNEPLGDGTVCDIDPTRDETCQNGLCVPDCVTAADCDDGVACTSEVCDDNGHCVYTPDDVVCNEGASFCDPVYSCEIGEGCVAGDAPDCDDGIACTVDLCSDSEGRCINQPSDSACNDFNGCTLDICDTQTGCRTEDEDDGTPCGVDYVCRSGECVPPVVDGDIDGDVDGDADADNDLTDGDATDGDVVDGDATDGDVVDGDETDGDVVDGDETDGDVVDGDETDGDVVDGDEPDGDEPDGDEPDGDEPDGDLDSDFGEEPADVDPDIPTDGDEPDGDDVGGGGSGGCSQPLTAPVGLLLMLALGLAWWWRKHRA